MLTCGVVMVESLARLKQKSAQQRLADYMACMLYAPTLNPGGSGPQSWLGSWIGRDVSCR